MTAMTGRHRRDDPPGFQHVALLHAGEAEFLEAALAHAQDGFLRDEPVIAALRPEYLQLFHDALGAEADRVEYLDMSVIGLNPGRLIPQMHALLEQYHGRGRLHLIGGSVWAERSAAENGAAVQSEALINLAVPDAPVSLLCPFDLRTLDPTTVNQAVAAHPLIQQGDNLVDSPAYDAMVAAQAAIGPLDEPEDTLAETMLFGAPDGPRAVRQVVAEHALRSGLDHERTADLCLAVHELAVNTVMHTGASGILNFWVDPDEGVVCEVQDSGWIQDPLAGRHPAGPVDGRGYGLYLVHQLCDLVRVSSDPKGTTTRVSMRLL